MKKRSKKGGIPGNAGKANPVKFKLKDTALQRAMDNTRLGNVMEAATRPPLGPRSLGKSPSMPPKRPAPVMALNSTRPWLEFRLRGRKQSIVEQVILHPDDQMEPMGLQQVDFHLSDSIASSQLM